MASAPGVRRQRDRRSLSSRATDRSTETRAVFGEKTGRRGHFGLNPSGGSARLLARSGLMVGGYRQQPERET